MNILCISNGYHWRNSEFCLQLMLVNGPRRTFHKCFKRFFESSHESLNDRIDAEM